MNQRPFSPSPDFDPNENRNPLVELSPANPCAVSDSDARFLLVKRGLYYRPNSSGYTGIKRLAGRFSENRSDPIAGVTAIHEDIAPIYAPACFHDMAAADFAERVQELSKGNNELLETAKALAALLAGFPDGEGLPS